VCNNRLRNGVQVRPLHLHITTKTYRLYRCHLGKSITYDTVSNLSWSVDIRTHSIVNVIDKVLAVPWLPAVDEGREVPEPKEEEDCVVSLLASGTHFVFAESVFYRSVLAGIMETINYEMKISGEIAIDIELNFVLAAYSP